MSERVVAEPAKMMEYWMEWEKGTTPPGKVISNLKKAGLPDLLDALIEAQRQAANTGAASADPGPEEV